MADLTDNDGSVPFNESTPTLFVASLDVKPMRLRRVEPDELAAAEQLLASNGLPTEDLRDVALFAGVVDSAWVGVCGLERVGSNALLRSVAIKQTAQGQGYGSALVRQLVAHAREQGIEDIYLLTTTAADFFASLGFSVMNRERVPSGITSTREFKELCPRTAACLHMRLC